MLLKNFNKQNIKAEAKQGDTIVEVMFALAVFSLVAILSISLMNMGVRSAEGSLEHVVARNELNAQAEALRFIHSSYISEMTLPECKDVDANKKNPEKCQQYLETWDDIVENAVTADEAASTGLLDLGRQVMDGGCNQFYEIKDDGKTPLDRVHAFVINTRKVTVNGLGVSSSYVPVIAKNKFSAPIFQPAELNARMIYTAGDRDDDYNSSDNVSDSTTTENGNNIPVIFNDVLYAEGIWVFAVKSSALNPTYYDFYIETCWYTPNSRTPSTLDTVIRLYNPKEVK